MKKKAERTCGLGKNTAEKMTNSQNHLCGTGIRCIIRTAYTQCRKIVRNKV